MARVCCDEEHMYSFDSDSYRADNRRDQLFAKRGGIRFCGKEGIRSALDDELPVIHGDRSVMILPPQRFGGFDQSHFRVGNFLCRVIGSGESCNAAANDNNSTGPFEPDAQFITSLLPLQPCGSILPIPRSSAARYEPFRCAPDAHQGIWLIFDKRYQYHKELQHVRKQNRSGS